MKTGLSAIVIKETDNVATALMEFKAGQLATVTIREADRKVALKSDISFLHKFALDDIQKGQKIIKYGHVIGEATGRIQKGEHVHIHTICSLRGRA